MDTIELIKPDDFHIHLRDGDYLPVTVAHAARQFRRAIVMPNLNPPVTTVELAKAYKARIEKCIPAGIAFTPLMTIYLTDSTDGNIINSAANSGFIYGCKLYPANATTNSAAGVTDIKNIYPALEQMAAHNLPLLIHGEVTADNVDVFDREKIFIDTVLAPLRQKIPQLKIVLEHITTNDAVEFVLANNNIAATITAHHLLLNRNDIFKGGINPHHYCLPILKREQHQQALIKAAISGNEKFFLGTDSAPHPQSKKLSSCGCAGIYTAHAAIEFYASVFSDNNVPDKLEAFASINGAKFYGLKPNKEKITLRRSPWQMQSSFDFAGDKLIPLGANTTINWKLDD